MDISLNQLIQFYLNNTQNFRPLTHRLFRVIPTKWRSYREHRLCHHNLLSGYDGCFEGIARHNVWSEGAKIYRVIQRQLNWKMSI